jgi:small subunit ribosomal protein S2
MALPTFTMRQMLEAGVHFGHVTRRWDPKMEQFIFGTRQKIHILDLQQTVPMMYRAMQAVTDAVAGGGRVLWVGTKRQAAQPVAEAAKRCGQYYVNHRWLGGMMTNWKTISNSIRRLKTLEEQLGENNEETTGLTKKELLKLTREHEKLDRSLGGIKDMGGLPDIVFVLDTNKESIAVAESNKLGIPVIGILDSNSNPDGIDYPIPGNDDSIRAINFYCDMISGSVLSGIQTEMAVSGVDLGELEITPDEDLQGKIAPEDSGKTVDVLAEAPEIAAEAKGDVSTEISELKGSAGVPAKKREQDVTS